MQNQAYTSCTNEPNCVCADKMVPTVGHLIGESEAQGYAARALDVWQVEQMHGELLSATDDERQQKLQVLDEAAGYFRAVSAHLRVSR